MLNVERLVPKWDEKRQRYFLVDCINNRLVQTISEGFKTYQGAVNYLNILREQHNLLPFEEKLFTEKLF